TGMTHRQASCLRGSNVTCCRSRFRGSGWRKRYERSLMALGTERLNWLVVGVGDITTRRVIPAIQAEPRRNLYGIVSRDRAKGEVYTGRVWENLDTALLDPQFDTVYVATPVFLHAPQSIAALRAGKHVLCEKPMAMNYDEARSMTSAARETG